MRIKHLPESDRPREKLLCSGANTLTDSELLAIFLRTGVNGKSAIELAQELLNTFGSLNALFDASIEELTQFQGMGSAKFAQLQAIKELSYRYKKASSIEKQPITCASMLNELFHHHLGALPHEAFGMALLDAQYQFITYKTISSGSISHTHVYPREVIKFCLQHPTKYVILAHNHPSGSTKASPADLKLTNVLSQALEYVEIDVIDHIIIPSSFRRDSLKHQLPRKEVTQEAEYCE